MTNLVNKVWKTELPANLAKTMTNITDEKVMRDFLRDVMTEKEIIEIAARFEAARMLIDGKTYTTIISKTKLSSRTVARISEWLRSGSGGYKTVIEQVAHHDHIPPARA
jgi:TrpR-related protein YerC/YecD